MKKIITLILISIPFFQSFAQDYYLENLTGINSFIVSVQVSEELKEEGLQFLYLKTSIELKLRTQAIKVIDLNSNERPDAEIRIKIIGAKISELEAIAFSSQISVHEYVSVNRLKTDSYYANTWSYSLGGYSDKDDNTEKFISDGIITSFDVFLNNYLRDNPK